MTVEDVLTELETLGNESTRKTLMRHGAREPVFGVKIEDLKKIHKRLKKNHELALALYATGNSDAMYLAGYLAEPTRMKKADLQKWVKAAYWYYLSDYTVAWVTAESPHALDLACRWIDSPRELIASAGWATLSGHVSITPDEKLDLDEIEKLLDRVVAKIHGAPNRTRFSMNGFVIAVGTAVEPLRERARAAAQKIGAVRVEMASSACKVPNALEYVDAVIKKGRGGKRKSLIC